MDIWFRKLGFFNNPLSIKPAAFHNELFGYDGIVNDLFEKVKNGEIILIEGDLGVGKTTILKKIIREFGGQRKLVYYSCNRKEYDLEIDDLLKGVYGFIGKLFGLRGNNMIALFDEAHELEEEDFDNLVENYENQNFKSIVLVTNDLKKVKLTPRMKELINKNIIKLTRLDAESSVSLIRKRIGGSSIISDDIIKKIYKKSENNPRKLLKNTEEVLRYVVDNGEEEVSEEHIKKVLG
jgi:type II secretory pathway predicted ATPase ExeA